LQLNFHGARRDSNVKIFFLRRTGMPWIRGCRPLRQRTKRPVDPSSNFNVSWEYSNFIRYKVQDRTMAKEMLRWQPRYGADGP